MYSACTRRVQPHYYIKCTYLYVHSTQIPTPTSPRYMLRTIGRAVSINVSLPRLQYNNFFSLLIQSYPFVVIIFSSNKYSIGIIHIICQCVYILYYFILYVCTVYTYTHTHIFIHFEQQQLSIIYYNCLENHCRSGLDDKSMQYGFVLFLLCPRARLRCRLCVCVMYII